MRLLLTRPKDQCEPLKTKLQQRGHRVFCLPLIEISPPKDGGLALRRSLKNISRYPWLIITSQNTLWVLRSYLKKFPKNLKVVRVGKEGVAGLIRFFKNKNMAGQRVLYPMSQIGRKELVRALRKKGAKVDVVEAYQTLPTKVPARKIHQILKRGIDAILFFSPSAVESFFSKIDPKDPLLQKMDLVPIGKTTGRCLQSFGYDFDCSLAKKFGTP